MSGDSRWFAVVCGSRAGTFFESRTELGYAAFSEAVKVAALSGSVQERVSRVGIIVGRVVPASEGKLRGGAGGGFLRRLGG